MNATYKIGEAAELLHLKTYVLRFWETEFPDIVPLRTAKGQRLYTAEHVALLERVRFLLHERGLTIEGARRILEEEKKRGVRYEFGVPGALAQPDPWSSGSAQAAGDAGEDGHAGLSYAQFPDPAGEAPRFRLNRPLPVYREEGAAFAPLNMFFPGQPAPAPGMEQTESAGPVPGQCNLPGVRPKFQVKMPFGDARSGVDSGSAEGYFSPAGLRPGPEHDALEDVSRAMALGSFDHQTDRRMLPLFAVAKAAYLAGRAAGESEGENRPRDLAALGGAGGGNFIAAGSGGAKAPDTGGPARRDAAEALAAIATELAAIAGMLKN